MGRGKTLRSLSWNNYNHSIFNRCWKGHGIINMNMDMLINVDMDMNMNMNMNVNVDMDMDVNMNMVTFSINGNHWENIYLVLGLRKIAHYQYILCKLQGNYLKTL